MTELRDRACFRGLTYSLLAVMTNQFSFRPPREKEGTRWFAWLAKHQDSGLAATPDDSADLGQAKLPEHISGDAFLAPLMVDEHRDPIGPCASQGERRCSDKGFLAMSVEDYLELLDWSARQVVPGKRGKTPENLPPVLKRLGLDRDPGKSKGKGKSKGEGGRFSQTRHSRPTSPFLHFPFFFILLNFILL